VMLLICYFVFVNTYKSMINYIPAIGAKVGKVGRQRLETGD